MHPIRLFVLLLLISSSLTGQTSFCPADPPLNTWLADSPWPTYHRNSYRQASTCLPGPRPEDELFIKRRVNISGGTSPWVYLSDLYPNGERVLYQSNATHVFKFIDTPEGIVTIDSLRIDFDPITSFGWNFILSRDKTWFAPDPKYDPEDDRYTRLLKFTDADPDDPYSEIVQVGEFSFSETDINKVVLWAMNYDGDLVFNSNTDEENNWATTGLVGQDFVLIDTLRYATFPGEIVHHNAFPIDENNSWYVVTTHRLIRFDWDGTDVSLGWQAPYDFVADGPTGSFAEGSGTTPTLMGWEDGEDQLIVLADGHNENNLVAFWRELPTDWTGLPGQDIRFAGSIDIPLAQASNNTFQSIENSPTVQGYEVAIAQYNGFLGYDCDNAKGVQKFTWNTASNMFELDWVNGDINMNGVLTYSSGSNLVYSSGKEADCNYYLYGLNWDTGTLDLRLLLGPEGTFLNDPFYDAGNNLIIDEVGDLFMPGGESLVKLEFTGPSGTTVIPENDLVRIGPNPVRDVLYLHTETELSFGRRIIWGITGNLCLEEQSERPAVNVAGLSAGVYFLQLEVNGQWLTKRFVKQ